MPDITSIGGLPSQITNPALPGGLVGNAAARFGQVLQNTMQQGVAELQGDVAQQLGSASQAAAEGGRFTPLTSGPDGQVAELAHSVSAAVSNRLEQVRASGADVNQKVETLVTGGDVDLHQVVLAAERAKLELQLTMQLRNKLIEAYQEVMRIPIG